MTVDETTTVDVSREQEQVDARPSRSLDEWINANQRLLFWIALVLSVPYLLTCLGLSLMIFQVMTTGGACG
jgi:hypothetical protein